MKFNEEASNGKDNGRWVAPDGREVSRNQAMTELGIPRRSYLEGIELPEDLKN